MARPISTQVALNIRVLDSGYICEELGVGDYGPRKEWAFESEDMAGAFAEEWCRGMREKLDADN